MAIESCQHEYEDSCKSCSRVAEFIVKRGGTYADTYFCELHVGKNLWECGVDYNVKRCEVGWFEVTKDIEGKRVKLKAFKEGDNINSEEEGEVCEDGWNWKKSILTLYIDKKYRSKNDDGLREVPFDQIKGLA